jgi:hypothetical protein
MSMMDILQGLAARADIDMNKMDEASRVRLAAFADSIAKYCGDQVGELARSRKRLKISETPVEFAGAATKELQSLFSAEPSPHQPSDSGELATGIWYSKSKPSKAAIRETGIKDPAFPKLVDAWLSSQTEYLFVGTKGGGGTDNVLFTLGAENEEMLFSAALDEVASLMNKWALPNSFVTAIDKDLARKLEVAWPKIVAKSGH